VCHDARGSQTPTVELTTLAEPIVGREREHFLPIFCTVFSVSCFNISQLQLLNRGYSRSPRLSSACRLFVVCLSRVRSPKLREIRAKFRCLYRKSGSESKNMTSCFASEVAKYPQTSTLLQRQTDNIHRFSYLRSVLSPCLNTSACRR